MKNKWMLLIMGMLMLNGITTAQVVTKDSINVLKNEKDQLKVAKSLNENKIKLAKLQNQVADRSNEVQKTTEESQKAASKNQDAADQLANDDQDKQKAKAASKSAKHAEGSAGDARKALDKLNDLYKDIEDLKKKLQEDEQKFVSLGGTIAPIPAVEPAKVPE